MRYQFIQRQLQERVDKQRAGKQRAEGRNRRSPSLCAWCQALDVSRSGYYAFAKRESSEPPPGCRAQQSKRLTEAIREVHETSRKTYGSPRVHAELLSQGLHCSLNRVARLMKQHQISARTKRGHRITTDSQHSLPVADNHLNREFTAAKQDQKWVCDITYLFTEEGWLYLAPVLDLYSRRVVGWSLKPHLQSELVRDALDAAVGARRPEAGLICHSDRGSQYASQEYQLRLQAAGITCSMSRKGNCYDNAVMESFFASLKKELIHRCRFKTREEARTKVFEWIEVWYNRKRRHSAIGYMAPVVFEEQQQGIEQSNQPSRIAA